MTPAEIIMRALECDQEGRILEAKILYDEGIDILTNLITSTKSNVDPTKRERYQERIKEYVDRSLAIKARIENRISAGSTVKSISIEDDSTGHSYAALFGAYLNDQVREVLLEEPYLSEKYHFQNLVMFCELLLKRCKQLKYMLVVTKRDLKAPENQRNILQQLHDDLGRRGITLTVKYDDNLHDRKIVLSNGYIIKLGRGLHIFKANTPLYTPGLTDYDYRKCLKNELVVFQTSSFNGNEVPR